MPEPAFETKQKPKLRLWWFLSIPVLAIGMIAVQGFGPNPPIQLGPDTTVLSEPLNDRGLPIYSQHFIEAAADGVTPENNAAVLYWKAMWPGELSRDGETAIIESLGMEVPDTAMTLEAPYGQDLTSRVEEWISVQHPDLDERTVTDIQDKVISQALNRLWKPGQLPIIDDWAKRNQQPLDWLVEGAARPKYFSPPPNAVNDENPLMFALLLPDVQMLRSASRALLLRAMWHMSHERFAEAWTNIHASYRVSRHCAAPNGFTIHILVGVAVEAQTNSTFLTLLDQELPSELLNQIADDLAKLPRMTKIQDAFSEGERFGVLDTIIQLSEGTSSEEMSYVLGGDGGATPLAGLASRVRIDWNVALQEANRWFDRMEEAAKLPHKERVNKFAEIDTELEGINPTNSSARLAHSFVSMRARSELVADTILTLMLPATQAVVRAQDRARMWAILYQTSVALARHRAARGVYPETLDALVPDYLPTVPIDYYADQQLVYRTRDDGYLLYSLFENGIDDMGTDISGNIVKGEYVTEPASIDIDKSDLVIRLPALGFVPPPIPEPEDAGE